MTQPPHASDTEPYEILAGDAPRADDTTAAERGQPVSDTAAPSDRTAAADAGAAAASFSPTPEHRPDWARPGWLDPAPAASPVASPAVATYGARDVPPGVPTQPVAVDR